MAYSKTRKTYKKKGTYKRKSYAKKGKRISSVKKLVRREIARNVETKSRETYVADRLLYFPAAAANFDSYNVVPLNFGVGGIDIVQGTGTGARIGNRIKVKKMTFKGTMVARPYDVTSNPIPFPTQWRVVFMYSKATPTIYPTPALSGNIYDLNNGVYPFQGDLVDMWAAINTDNYTVLAERRFKLGYASSNLRVDGTTGPQNYANNDFQYNCNFNIDITKMVIQNQIFQDNSSESRSRQLWAVFIPSPATGGTGPSATVPAELMYSLKCAYEDA